MESVTAANMGWLNNRMTNWIYEVVYAFFFIFPAYVANAIPVVLGGGPPIDLGRKWFDGKPIFGSHKTIRGFAAGVTAGTLTGLAQEFVLHSVAPSDFVLPFQFSVFVGFVVSFGALLGDLAHSFVKRRISIVEGAPLPIADQLDFVAGAVLLSFLAPPPHLNVLTVAIIFVITLPTHLLTNVIAYLAGVKKTPW
jgi:CDP-2,3-bis-(O-geranylgeranyl)-sn-glycerol synthase